MPFLRLDPREWILVKGEKSISFSFSAANDIRKMDVNGVQRINEDYENDVLRTRYRQGLGHGLDFTLDVPLVSRGGGFMDPIISAWHKLFDLTNNARTGAPYGQAFIQVPGADTFRDAIGIGDVSLAISKELTPRLMSTVAVKLPTGNAHQILGSGNFDGAFDVQYKMPISHRWQMQLQAGLVGQGQATDLQSTRGLNPIGSLVLMHKANDYDSYVFQWQTESSGVTTGVGGSDSPHRTVSVGYQRRIGEHRMFEVYFTEDGDWANTYHVPELANIGPDFTLGARFVIHF